MNRLKDLPTLRIEPGKKVCLSYKGKSYEGVRGDTIASALYANDVRVFARSLKYHRPRGLYSLDGECSNTMMQVDGVLNVFCENTLAAEGMNIKPQNVLGNADFDLMGFMDKLSFAMPAGFYYKIFHKPAFIWPLAIKQIRKAAGLGKISPDFRIKGNYDEIYPSADVCVAGGGPAGMCAALAAAQKGLRVIILEARPWLGGFFDYRPGIWHDDILLYQRAEELARQVKDHPFIRVFTNTYLTGVYSNDLVTAFCQGSKEDCFTQRYVEIRTKTIIGAAGCIERPLLFENNEKPGVMQPGCAHRLARTWGLLPGKSAVFSIGHDLGIEAAVDLFDLGMEIQCVADVREHGQDFNLAGELEKRKIPYYPGWTAVCAQGWKGVKKVRISSINGKHEKSFDCDILAASAGMTPVTGPLTLAGAKLEYDNHTGFFLPGHLPDKIHAAGRMLGLNNPLSIEASGTLAGLKAAADCGIPLESEIIDASDELAELPGPEMGSRFVCAPVGGKKTFICFDEDCTLKNIDQAMKDGFDVPELIKRFTSAGTGPGQGGIPGHNLPLYTANTQVSPDNSPKPTTVRTPLVPPYLAAYAGFARDMSKRTPVHESQEKSGGKMERIGVWNRARRFADDESARMEIENVRNNVGMLDASTLGKFRIFGPDALKALERVYVSSMAGVKQGRIKYSAMCNEDGCVIDDGVVTKCGENDYYLTTSTGRAGVTSEWIRFHTRYDNWDFNIVNLTDAFGVINLAGPNARKVLEKVTDADVSDTGFPFSGYREFLIQDTIFVRAMRLGFVGELSYELHVPSSYMQSLWDILQQAGKEFGIENFGLEAQSTLRMEKGHVILGSESEQRTTLHDIGLGFLWHQDKPEAKTIGAPALAQTKDQKGRLKLAGFKAESLETESIKDGSPIVDTRIRGYVCTARYSWTLKQSIGMALVDDELAAENTRLGIYEDGCNGELKYARVVPMPFYDPQGQRMRM
ncbi:Sarcosine oxidase, subunit alpha [Desulfonema limicola]|uniref:Sarcosine oxidase, subunit alpha n=1 Tax=Desulfonema limicola TaxID=45656 RepID=A0A975B8R0_9BACT|nr:2Fe-2S iron-sulfur cluster-binding protein [Desulfonema limicola]QTA80928.1 Sarcosine oxidase, subunit alpha [Desulfonema limicola]